MTEPRLPLIPRHCLFGDATRHNVQISPDGKLIVFIAPLNGVDNVWVAPAEDVCAAKAVTQDTTTGIRLCYWAHTNCHLILAQDYGGDENFQFSVLNIDTSAVVQLTNNDAAETRLLAMSPGSPTQILIQTNERDPQYFDTYRADILTGNLQLVERNDRFAWVYADQNLKLRLAEELAEDGGIRFYVSEGNGEWRFFTAVPLEDESVTRPFRLWECANTFSVDAAEVYALDSRGRNFAALVAWNLQSGESRVIVEDEAADIFSVTVNPTKATPDYYIRSQSYLTIHALDEGAGKDLEILTERLGNQIEIISQSNDDRRWLVARCAPEHPDIYFLYDRDSKNLTTLFSERPALDQYQLARMYPEVISARDGLQLVSYVSYPPDVELDSRHRPLQPQPLVVMVHGGPWVRDTYSYDPWIQLLANRGYSVLTINYRGSKGFGKSFLNKGNREWGGKMYTDIIDGVHWAIREGIARRDRVALMGASFGGYTTLVGMAQDSQLFACGVDMFGISNLPHFLDTIPPHWKVYKRMWDERVGNIETDLATLKERSPIYKADTISKPLLIAQGSNDARVVQSESDQIAEALQARSVEVIYLLYPDEGHGFQQSHNQMSFFAVLEAFLSKHLGGRVQAPGDDLEHSSVKVPVGREVFNELVCSVEVPV